MRYLHCQPGAGKSIGFTLIEVLVTLLLLSISLLGILALQITAFTSAQQSQWRSQAGFAAEDMAERMRLNTAAVAAGAYLAGEGGSFEACLSGSECSPVAMAQSDLGQWRQWLASSLPQGAGTISAPRQGVREIIVSWDSDRDGQRDQTIQLFIRSGI